MKNMIDAALAMLEHGLQPIPLYSPEVADEVNAWAAEQPNAKPRKPKAAKEPYLRDTSDPWEWTWMRVGSEGQPAELLTPAMARQHHRREGLFIGIICGAVSGGLEVVDVDTKNDPTGHLWNDLCHDLDTALPHVMRDMVIQRTMNGGRHLIYRCSTIGRNEDLANRKDGPVLIETRAEAGYVACWPSDGYELEQGSWDSISTITPEDRDVLLSICRSFNELEKEQPPSVGPQRRGQPNLSKPLDDYRMNGDALSLLEKHGWKLLHRKGQRVYLRRPLKTEDVQGANWSMTLRKLYVHTSSTTLRQGRAYNAVDLYAHYEAGGDIKEAARQLASMGYGGGSASNRDPFTAYKEHEQRTDAEPGQGAADGTDAEPELKYMTLENMYDELVDLGPPIATGMPTLDEEGVKIRSGALTIVAAQPAAGKSMFLINLMLSMAKEHKDKAMVFFSGEMPASEVLQRMLTASLPDNERRRRRLLAGTGSQGGAYLFSTTAEGSHAMLYLCERPLQQGTPLAINGQLLDRGVHGEMIGSDGELIESILRMARQRQIEPTELLQALSVMSHPALEYQMDEAAKAVMKADIAAALDAVLPALMEGRVRIISASQDRLPIALLQQQIDGLAHPLGAVLMDYATLLTPAQENSKEMRIRMVAAANELKGAAKRWLAPVIVAAQTNVRDAAGGNWRPEHGRLPASYYEALGKPHIADGDVLAESSQFQRASACTMYLATPTQMAGGSRPDLLEPWQQHGEMPIYVKVVKNRGGRGNLFFKVNWRPCCGQISMQTLVPPDGVRLQEDALFTPQQAAVAPVQKKRRPKPTEHAEESSSALAI
jgi:hypothetical protein